MLSLLFSPDGRRLLSSGTTDLGPSLWTLEKEGVGSSIKLVRPPGFYDVAFLQGISEMAYGAQDSLAAWAYEGSKTVMLWHLLENRPIGAPLDGIEGQIVSLQFVENDRALLGVDSKGTVIRWELDVHTLAKRACEAANRQLSQDEWRYYFGSETPYSNILSYLNLARRSRKSKKVDVLAGA